MAGTGQISAGVLRSRIDSVLRRQGYRLRDGEIMLDDLSRDSLRTLHQTARAERLFGQEKLIVSGIETVKRHMINGKNLDVSKIDPVLQEVRPGTVWETLFRWWNYVWWSLPFEKAYGRQMRYVVWDRHHRAAIGLIGLCSPILSCARRDSHLGIAKEHRDFWINQSMSAQRLGALPPYNEILGGKLVAMLLTHKRIRRDFREKYRNRTTLMQGRRLPANLLFVTTTGAFGKSSIYNRLKFDGDLLAKFIGYTRGAGSFHIPDEIYEELVEFLRTQGVYAARGYGNGPSRKMRLIHQAMTALGYKNGNCHHVPRAIYLFPMVSNLPELISGKHLQPRWQTHITAELVEFWKRHWVLPRLENRAAKLRAFRKEEFIAEELRKLQNCLRTVH